MIGVLGPKGTFSHQAGLNCFDNGDICFYKDVWSIFESLQNGDIEYGVVPVENSLEGSVGVTLDALLNFDAKIKDEIILKISHCLCGSGDVKNIDKVYSHPQALAQCREYLKDMEKVQTSSTAKAAEMVKERGYNKEACICPELCAEIYGLKVIKRDVQDNGMNATRFFVIGKNDSEKTGYDKTSIAFYTYQDRPGLLYDTLKIFANRNINLTKIESRPSKNSLGEYVFYLDMEGHRKEKNINDAIKELKSEMDMVKIFGSYPKKR